MTARYPGVPYFFYGEADERLGQRLVLFVEGEQSEVTLEVLGVELKNLLGKFEIPKQIYLLPRFKYTPSGKINRPETANKT
jgi:O-succinylbenzoic acid--CoA ligase